MNLDLGQKTALLRLIEETPWGDIEGAVVSLETALRRAMEATVDDFLFWEERAEAADVDEFQIEPWQVEAMTPEWRRAYVARLLRSAALNYGLGTEYGGELGVSIDTGRDALAPLLHDLTEIATQGSRQEQLLPAVRGLNESLQQVASAPEQRQGWYLAKAERQAEAILAGVRVEAARRGRA